MRNWHNTVKAAVLATVFPLCTAWAQQTSQQLIEDLLSRVSAAEARIKDLEGKLEQRPQASNETAAAAPAPLPMPAQLMPESGGHDHGGGGLIASGLQMRGFGDIQYVAGDHAKRSTFVLGQFDLFMTSRLADHWTFLAESVVQADPSNNSFGFEIERLQLNYARNEYLNVGFGRYHQSIGYYNTAYHHGTWFQTTTGRPYIFAFEDEGGILPIHNVGVTVSGKLPSGKLDLQYAVEFGNGRTSRSQDTEFVQNVFDENNRKSVNIALSSRPQWFSGLQIGGSFLKDRLYPEGGPKLRQTIASGYAVYHHDKVELLNEFILMRNAAPGAVMNTPGFYTQISRGWRALRPYIRYEYVNVNRRDPYFGDIGRRSGPLGGLRWDAGEFSAFKLELGRLSRTGLPTTTTVAAQVAFAF
ncbi:MAG: hypothetical protein ABJF23_10950 [Bryobacteraceae bacterium]